MNRATKALLALLAVVALGAGGFAVFERFERQGVAEKGERACGNLDAPAAAGLAPTAFTLPEGQKALSVQTQGKTTLFVASTAGTRDDVVEVRDAVVADLKGQGFELAGTDQEPGYEAEAQLEGRADASVKVRPLCEGRLEVRYTVRG